MLRVIPFFVLYITCSGAAPKSSNFLQNVGIFGGQAVDIKDYPYQVAVAKHGEQFCGGSIISELWVLSAAHCGLGVPTPLEAYSLRVGSSFIDRDGTLYSVAQIITHKNFKEETLDFDVGLFKAASPIVFGDLVKPIKLAERTPPAGTKLTITGWGEISQDLRVQPEQLQMVQIPEIDHKLCEKEHAPIMNVTRNMLCGEVAGSGDGFCHGDSGGAATDGEVQVGIVSWRWPQCIVPGKPNVFTDVAAVRQWIRDNAGV